MSLTIPDEILRSAHMSERELQQEIAVMLFREERLTLGQASRLAGMSRYDFQRLLGDREISPHYGVNDFEQDLETLGRLGRV